MKITEKTKSILKNFAQINPSIYFNGSSEISTIALNQAIVVYAEVPELESFVGGIYDLNKFLAVLSLFQEPNINVNKKQIKITEGNKNIDFTFASRDVIKTPPDGNINFKDPDISIEISWEELEAVLKACNILNLDKICITGDKEKISLGADNVENNTSDVYNSIIGETDNEFKFVFRADNFKLLNLDYKVSILKDGLAKFESAENKITYFIAVEENSSFYKG